MPAGWIARDRVFCSFDLELFRTLGQASNVIRMNEAVDQSFPRSTRLLTAKDYAGVFSRNKRFSDKYWSILVHRSGQPCARIGLAIAKKRAKRAVDRNKLKRVAREAFRCQRESLTGLELVVMNRDGAGAAVPRELRASIDSLLTKIIRSTNPSGGDNRNRSGQR